jgi:hypothetical protein
MNIDNIAGMPGHWLVVNWLGHPIAGPAKFVAALWHALDLSAKTASVFDAPAGLAMIGSDERVDAYATMWLWRELGWLR